MENKKQMIDAKDMEEVFDNCYDTAFIQERTRENKEYWKGYCSGINWGRNAIADAPKVEAVEVKQYKTLIEMYNQLRENFVDFVCSGILNVAPYCLNRCEGCCDSYGWCMHSNKCMGFNPAEVILDEEWRTDNDRM